MLQEAALKRYLVVFFVNAIFSTGGTSYLLQADLRPRSSNRLQTNCIVVGYSYLASLLVGNRITGCRDTLEVSQWCFSPELYFGRSTTGTPDPTLILTTGQRTRAKTGQVPQELREDYLPEMLRSPPFRAYLSSHWSDIPLRDDSCWIAVAHTTRCGWFEVDRS